MVCERVNRQRTPGSADDEVSTEITKLENRNHLSSCIAKRRIQMNVNITNNRRIEQ